MKYLKKFSDKRFVTTDKLEKSNESKELSKSDIDAISDLKDCFIHVIDMIDNNAQSGVRVKKINREYFVGGKSGPTQFAEDSYEVMIIPKLLPGQDASADEYINGFQSPYRKTVLNTSIIDEIEDAISLSEGNINLTLNDALVEWTPAFDHRIGENGPGMVNKRFSKDGTVVPQDVNKLPIGGLYNLDYLIHFLNEKGDKIRWIKLWFK